MGDQSLSGLATQGEADRFQVAPKCRRPPLVGKGDRGEALAWAVFIPLTQPGFGNNVFFIITVAAVVSVGASLWVLARYQAAA